MESIQERMLKEAPTNKSKAKVQAFLSGMPKTVPQLGVAAKKGYWPFNNDAFLHIRNFLTDLMSD